MNTEERFGLKKSTALLLFAQMILTILLLITAIYLLIFVIRYQLGGWMVASYVCITLSILAIIAYSFYGYQKGDAIYQLSILPYLLAIFLNILLPGRSILQIALLTILFALTFAFLLRQRDEKFTRGISALAVAVALVFSVYSAITADVGFLGDLSSNWPTYLAMYLSIFIPTIMSGTLALTYHVRVSR